MTRVTPVKKIIQVSASVLFFILIFTYGISRSRDLLFGIKLNVDNIEAGQSFVEPVIDIRGSAKRATGVVINGQTAILGEDGFWRGTVALLPGYNPMTIIATDKFGKSVTRKIPIYYKAPPAPIQEIGVESVLIPETSEQTVPEVQ